MFSHTKHIASVRNETRQMLGFETVVYKQKNNPLK